MYLKRLEMMGFKSFADRIRLDFLPGVTGVVGPNGSGKSNISDALRWVLGEQSVKNLRGLKMDDVIFAGSEVRKPLGLAEVTIVLDNSQKTIPVDFTEIAVTRKLFRSGESEYYINKSPVRLKDIHELFYDTGLGKEAYSVIGQGKIDAILSVKAEERRAIFEEAAGIIKYKSRKQIAQRKLEDTNHSLLRLKDILNELNTQMGPLESQAALAEQYIQLKEKLTYSEINYFGSMILDLEGKLAESQAAKAEVLERYQDFERQENVIESEIEESRLALLNQDNQIASLNEDYFRVKNQIEKYQEQINFLKEKIESITKQTVELETNREENLKKREAIRLEEASIDSEVGDVQGRLNEQEKVLAELDQILKRQDDELAEYETAEQDIKNEIIEILNEAAVLKNKVNSLALQKDYLGKQIADTQKKLDMLKHQLQESESVEVQQKSALQEAGHEINAARRRQEELTRQISQSEERLTALEGKNLDWKERIRGIESKMGLLEEMERGYQGYFQGVKALLAEAAAESFHKGIRGIVADLIQVQPGMELAIETALGSGLQNIVIETDQYAQDAVSYLKKYSKGRATFLPLNLVRGNENRTSQIQRVLDEHACQSAVSLLNYDLEYKPLLHYLLGQTIVAPDLKTAVRISSKLEKSFRIVTPEGDLVNPGGSITGGSVDKRRLGLLSRRREIEDLKTEKNDALRALEKGIETAKRIKIDIQEDRGQLESVKSQESEAKFKKLTLERELETFVQTIRQNKQEQELFQAQLEELVSETHQFDFGKDEALTKCAAKEEAHATAELKLADLTGAMRRRKAEREETNSRITQYKSSLSAAYQEKNGKITLKERLARQINELDEVTSGFVRKKQEYEAETIRIEENRAEILEKITAEEARLVARENELGTSRRIKDEILVKIKELENKERSFRRKSNDFQNQIHKYDLAVSQQMSDIENIRINLTEDYGEDWLVQKDPSWEDPGGTKETIDELKGSLKALGPVNLASIEDYRQLKDRCHFLTTQMEDLEKAQDSLLKVISEIERTITKRFTDSFAVIRNNFRRIFGELFEGGNADLMLIEPENPLDSGIEVIAQPPGKKLQSLSLLSGGERAMTAIALLFSILEYKPSPFCVLDEIDATLDEVNVHRFSKLLELFSKDLQFIVVTHRRGTMEAANALYGVTMEELGVSKLISLDLTEKAG